MIALDLTFLLWWRHGLGAPPCSLALAVGCCRSRLRSQSTRSASRAPHPGDAVHGWPFPGRAPPWLVVHARPPGRLSAGSARAPRQPPHGDGVSVRLPVPGQHIRCLYC